MSTSVCLRLAVIATAHVSLVGCVIASPSGDLPSPAFDVQNGGHIRILSAYLRNEPQAVVRGMVRREMLWRGPVNGHLHITAYASDGQVISRRATTWIGPFAGPNAPARAYQVDLDVPRADVVRVAVAFASGRHTTSESFQ